jgi:formimidoylglutamase
MSVHVQASEIVVFEEPKDTKDLRLKNLILPWDGTARKADVGVVGIPFDLGVRNSCGRLGAKKAPDDIRYQMTRYGTVYNIARQSDFSGISIVDFGNVVCDLGNVIETHKRVTETLEQLFQICNVLIVLGGGNDLTYATVRALHNAFDGCDSPIRGVNVDAHLDVRESDPGSISSGTPYRRLIEDCLLNGSDLWELAIQGHVNSKAHFDWAKAQGVNVLTLDELRRVGVDTQMEQMRDYIKPYTSFVSVDIDSVAQAFAPGSSAPSPDGLLPHDICQIAYQAGTVPSLRLFEIMEVNPLYDVDNRTSRLAVNIILEFLAGYARRS